MRNQTAKAIRNGGRVVPLNVGMTFVTKRLLAPVSIGTPTALLLTAPTTLNVPDSSVTMETIIQQDLRANRPPVLTTGMMIAEQRIGPVLTAITTGAKTGMKAQPDPLVLGMKPMSALVLTGMTNPVLTEIAMMNPVTEEPARTVMRNVEENPAEILVQTAPSDLTVMTVQNGLIHAVGMVKFLDLVMSVTPTGLPKIVQSVLLKSVLASAGMNGREKKNQLERHASTGTDLRKKMNDLGARVQIIRLVSRAIVMIDQTMLHPSE